MPKKKIIVLGATGSIGESTLDIVRKHRDRFMVTALSAHTGEERLLQHATEFSVPNVCLSGRHSAHPAVNFQDVDGLLRMITETDADLVLNGIAGSKGLVASVATLRSGKDLALANKETMVMAGRLVRRIADENGRMILPVDSELSALFQMVEQIGRERIDELILTASGGAFRDLPVERLPEVTAADALHHPVWSMGKKITIDSATMANKGLEIMETSLLFDLDISRVKVLIHPHGYVHALARSTDSAIHAQISRPDMRLPIQNALTYPELIPAEFARLNLAGANLTFSDPDPQKYPLLFLAFDAARAGGPYPIVYNASNEVAVDLFLSERIGFTDIASIVSSALERDWPTAASSIEEVLQIDSEAREFVKELQCF